MFEDTATYFEKFIKGECSKEDFARKYLEEFIYPDLEKYKDDFPPVLFIKRAKTDSVEPAGHYTPVFNSVVFYYDDDLLQFEYYRVYIAKLMVMVLAHEHRHFQQQKEQPERLAKTNYNNSDDKVKKIISALKDSDESFRIIIEKDPNKFANDVRWTLYLNNWCEVDAKKYEEKRWNSFNEYLKNYPDLYKRLGENGGFGFEELHGKRNDYLFEILDSFKREGLDNLVKKYQNHINSIGGINTTSGWFYNKEYRYLEDTLIFLSQLLKSYDERLLEVKYHSYVKRGFSFAARILGNEIGVRQLPIYKALLFKGENLCNESFYGLKSLDIKEKIELFSSYINSNKLEYCFNVAFSLYYDDNKFTELITRNGVIYEKISKIIDGLEAKGKNNSLLYDDVDDAMNFMEQIMNMCNCTFIEEDDRPKNEIERDIKYLYDRLHNISIKEIEKVNPYYDLNSNRYRHSQDRRKYLMSLDKRIDRYENIYGHNFVVENYNNFDESNLSDRSLYSLIEEFKFIQENDIMETEEIDEFSKNIFRAARKTARLEGVEAIERIYNAVKKEEYYDIACAILNSSVFGFDELIDFYVNYQKKITKNNLENLKMELADSFDSVIDNYGDNGLKILEEKYENHMINKEYHKAYFYYKYISERCSKHSVNFDFFENNPTFSMGRLAYYSNVYKISKLCKENSCSIDGLSSASIDIRDCYLNYKTEIYRNNIKEWESKEGIEAIKKEFKYRISNNNYELAYYLYVYFTDYLEFEDFKKMCKTRNNNVDIGKR